MVCIVQKIFLESSDIGCNMGVKDPEVGKFREKKLKLSRPRFNFGARQKSELPNFVLEGHPNVLDQQQYMLSVSIFTFFERGLVMGL